MTDCICGHDRTEHQDGTGRCNGECYDPAYGSYRCVCPYVTKDRT